MGWTVTVGKVDPTTYNVVTTALPLDPDDAKSIAAFILALDDFKATHVISTVRDTTSPLAVSRATPGLTAQTGPDHRQRRAHSRPRRR